MDGYSLGKGQPATLLCKWLIKILNERDKECEKLPLLKKERIYNAGLHNSKGYSYSIDHTYISAINELLIPITSTCFKPDVAILWNRVPAILFEINSSPMADTIAKLFANLIDVLRYIRHFNPSITSWVGFAFPKNEVNSTNNFACKVEVVWKECKFVCTIKSLERKEIKTEVQETFSCQISVVKTLQMNSPSARFLVPLSKEDLNLIATQISRVGSYGGPIHLTQVWSQFSILLTNGAYYFKFPGYPSHQSALKDLAMIYKEMDQTKQDQFAKHLVLPIVMLQTTDDNLFALPFFVFPALKFQLAENIAKQCLPDLANGIINGLDKLHSLRRAHLDVRLPNVCVSEDYEVKLIDFDRSSTDVSVYGGVFMYTFQTEKKEKQGLDWKQFGLLLFTLSSYNGNKYQSELTKDDIPQQPELSPFLDQLIRHRSCDRQLKDDWIQSLQTNQKYQLRDVL